jgi:two-component system CheB/CheR fusion protein
MVDNADLSSSQDDPGKADFPVVGIGASAGGINALRQFFSSVGADCGMAFVVILHLSPRYESNLAAVLQANTPLPVIQVNQTVRVQPNHVYVIPPNNYLVVENGSIKLIPPEHMRGGPSSIELFFRTLADSYNKDAIGVVLSGTGADGTLGLRRIKEHGGFAIAQDPAEAEYGAMPRSAIDAGLVDLILPAAQIAGRIRALSAVAGPAGLSVEMEKQAPESEVRQILTLLRERTGQDFSQYKLPTTMRRIARRMQVHDVPDIISYLSFFREHAEEAPALLRDLMISVTNFFRDREAFEALKNEVIPKLFAGKRESDQVRVWVVGCATGEEAYSIAMLLLEYAAALEQRPKIQIFATDIDERAIGQAREGCFAQTIALDVSPERLTRFFTKEGDKYRVKKEVRELILFASHNVLRDPPFSKLDLVSCRNLLIYLNREMQERALVTFHFALSAGGFLFLGTSETAESFRSLFGPLDNKHRIFTRRPAVVAAQPIHEIPRLDRWDLETPPAQEVAGAKASYGVLHQQVVEKFAPPSVLINEEYELVHVSEHAGRFLRFRGGEPTRNLLAAVLPDLRLDLQAILLTAKASGVAAESRRVRVEIDGRFSEINMTARHVSDIPAEAQGFYLVIFNELRVPPETEQRASAPAAPDLDMVNQLGEELQRTRDQLRFTVEQYETTTQELKVSNEELQGMNEELRSTTEELETSKAELQSVNEELTTVNQELQEKVEERDLANSDLQNLLSSTQIGAIFLDRDLNIKRYTEPATELFNIAPQDIGRPLEHFSHKLEYEALMKDAKSVLRTLQSREREVRGSDGRWYLARLLPYRTLDDKIDGVVLSLIDITEHADIRQLRQRSALLQAQVEILDSASVFIRGMDDRIALWSGGCQRLFGYRKDEALGQVSHELLHMEFPRPLDELKQQLVSTGSWEGRLVHTTKGGERLAGGKPLGAVPKRGRRAFRHHRTRRPAHTRGSTNQAVSKP